MKLPSFFYRMAFAVLLGCVLGAAMFLCDPINRLSRQMALADSRGELSFEGPWSGYRASSPTDAAMAFERSEPGAKIVELRRILLPRSRSAEVYGAIVVEHNYRVTTLVILRDGKIWLVHGI